MAQPTFFSPLTASMMMLVRASKSDWTVRLVLLSSVVALVATLGACGERTDVEETTSDNVVPTTEVERRVEAARDRLTKNAGAERVLRAIEAHGGLEA